MLGKITNLLKCRKKAYDDVQNKKDYASVEAEKIVIKGIEIPVITLGEYPGIAKRIADLIEKLGTAISEDTGKPIDEILDTLQISDLLRYIPKIIEVASEEFFGFLASILKVEVDAVRKLSLADLTRILTKIYEINEFAEIQEEIGNFIQALAKKKSRGETETGRKRIMGLIS